MKHLLLGIRVAIYISLLLFFNNDIILFSAVALINILILESMYYSFLPVILILFLPMPYKILLSISFLIYLLSYPLIKKHRYYSLLIYFLISVGNIITLAIINLFTYNTAIIAILILLIIFILTKFFMFTTVNKKNYTAAINEDLLENVILFCYLLLGLYFNNDAVYFYLLFTQIFITLNEIKAIFFITYLSYSLIFRLNYLNVIEYAGISYFPLLSLLKIEPTSPIFYYQLINIIFLYLYYYLNKKANDKNVIRNNITYFKSYIEDLKKEYARVSAKRVIDNNEVNQISKTICSKCMLNTPCKTKLDIRRNYIIGAISGNGNNYYSCPSYTSFYNNTKTDSVVKLEGLAIDILTEAFDDIININNYSNRLYKRFLKEIAFYGYKPNKFIIYDKYNTTFIALTFKEAIINTKLLLRLASRILKEELEIKCVNNDIENTCYIYKKPKLKLDYEEKIYAMDENIVSGDNFLIKRDYNDSYLFILSDGMGNGYHAFKESMEVIKLMEKLLSYPFNITTSLKMLKSIYQMKEEFDSYATLDILIINTAKKIMSLYKMGSTTTYLFHDKILKKLENKALPMELDLTNSSYEIEIYRDDIIILASDGVSDYISDEELIDILNHNTIPCVIENKIIEKIKKNEGTLKDDASLIVINIY